MKLTPMVSATLALALACASGPPPETLPEPVRAPVAPIIASPEATAESAPISTSAPVTDTIETAAGPIRVMPIHHGTVALGLGDTTLIVDPYSEAPEGSLPKADIVLITDIHRDHFDPAAIAKVRKPNTIFVAPKVVAEKLPEAKILANGEERTELGVRIEAIAMYNLERGPEPGKRFHDKGRGNGYVLTFGGKRIYVSGDTECTPEMRALARIDLAFVCMNLPFTMTPKEAAECVNAFKPAVLIPYHYRGSKLEELQAAIAPGSGVELRVRDFYAKKD